jgi:hypothetical protein
MSIKDTIDNLFNEVVANFNGYTVSQFSNGIEILLKSDCGIFVEPREDGMFNIVFTGVEDTCTGDIELIHSPKPIKNVAEVIEFIQIMDRWF